MFKSLALVATVANSAIVTLDGALTQATNSPAKASLTTTATKSITCAAQSGYKVVTADTEVIAYASSQFTVADSNSTAYDWTSVTDDVKKWIARTAIAGAKATTYPTFLVEMENNAITASKVTYTAAAALPTVAEMEAATVSTGAKIDKWPTASTATAAGMPTGDDVWIYDMTKSTATVATATVGAIGELTIKKTIKTKAKIDAFAMKESMTVGCGLTFNKTTPDKKGVVKTADWTFATAAGSVATMAGASVVAAAALLF